MRFACLVIAMLAFTPAITARAESPEDAAFAKKVFGKAPGKQPASVCYARVYDAAHLAAHPRQNVRTMNLLVSTHLEDDGSRGYGLRLGVQFRRSDQKFQTQGDCGSIHDETAPPGAPAQIACGVECDGGALDVSVRDDRSVRLTIPDGARLWRPGRADDDETDSKTRRKFGADDKLFRLDPAPLTLCLPLVGDASDRRALGIAH